MANNPLVNPFEAPTSAPKGEMGKGTSTADIEDFLSSDDKTPEPKKEPEPEEDEEPVVKPEPESDDEDTEGKEDDEDDKIKIKDTEEDDSEDKELPKEEDVSVPPKKSAILAKYPEFFKEFPAVEKMIYRDRAYAEMFGSIEDAKELVERSENLGQLETQLLSGTTVDVLKKVKEADPKAFDKIVDNYLSDLEKVDKDAFLDVGDIFAKRIMKGMLESAKSSNNKELHNAAVEMHKHLYGHTDWKEPSPRVPVGKDEGKEALDKERAAFMEQKFVDARDGLQTRVDNLLRSTISDNIDPRGVMSAYEKKNAISDALNRIHGKIGEDKAFLKNLQRLWGNAFNKNFSKETIEAIRKTYLGKSTPILNTVLKDVRSEITKGKSNRGKEDEDKTPSEPRKSTNAGRPSQQTGKKANERKPGESVQEFFMRD